MYVVSAFRRTSRTPAKAGHYEYAEGENALVRVPGGPDPSHEQRRTRQQDENAGGDPEVPVESVRHRLPLVAREVAQSHERAAPQHGARVRRARERAVADRRRPGGYRGDVTHARYEVPEGEEPVTEAEEPSLGARKCRVWNVKHAVEGRGADRPTEDIAQCDPCRTAGDRRSHR